MTPSVAEKKQPTPASYADFSDDEGGGWLSTAVQFFAIPLLIVCVAVGLYLGISLMVGSGPETAADFVELLRSDTINRRWQAAYELADRLRNNRDIEQFHEPRLIKALNGALLRAREEQSDPPRLAMFLLQVLGALKDPGSLAGVRAALEDRNDWTRSYAILAAAALGDRESIPRFREYAAHTDSGTRQAALRALAYLDQVEGLPYRLSTKTNEIALAHLGDRHEDVRFGAALVLSKAGDRTAVPTLTVMLNRKKLEEFDFDDKIGGIDRHKVRGKAILAAIHAVERLDCGDVPEVIAALGKLADDSVEGDFIVREAARKALRKLESKQN